MPSAIRAIRPPTSAPLTTMPSGAGKNSRWSSTRASSGPRNETGRNESPSLAHCVRSIAAVIALLPPCLSCPSSVPRRAFVSGPRSPRCEERKHHVAHLILRFLDGEALVQAERLPGDRAESDLQRTGEARALLGRGAGELGGEGLADLRPGGLAALCQRLLEGRRERLLVDGGPPHARADLVELDPAGEERLEPPLRVALDLGRAEGLGDALGVPVRGRHHQCLEGVEVDVEGAERHPGLR